MSLEPEIELESFNSQNNGIGIGNRIKWFWSWNQNRNHLLLESELELESESWILGNPGIEIRPSGTGIGIAITDTGIITTLVSSLAKSLIVIYKSTTIRRWLRLLEHLLIPTDCLACDCALWPPCKLSNVCVVHIFGTNVKRGHINPKHCHWSSWSD